MTDDETGCAGDARRGPGLERSPAVDQLSEAVIVADADGSITFFNDAALRLHGDGLDRGGPEAHADGFRLLTMDGQPFGPAEFPLARALSGETVRDVRWRVRRPDDSEIVAIGSASPLVDSEGRRIGAVLTARDQTERTMAEEALRESEARARADAERVQLALAAGAILGTWFWDLPSDRFTVDEQFANAFGLDPTLGREGLTLAQVIDTVHPDDKPGLQNAIEEAISRGGPYHHQYRVQRRDGNYYWIEANGRVDHAPDGTPLYFPGVLIDVEERRAVARERDQAMRLLEMFTQAVPGVVYAKDRNGRMLVANRGTTELVGLPPEAYLGKTDAEFLDDPEQAALVMQTDRRIMESGVAEQVEEEVHRADGSRAIWLSTKEPLRNPAGEVIGLIGSSVDITSWRTAEEARALLMREVDHRARNALVTVQSIIRLSDSTDPERFRQAVAGRVDALARAQSSLTRSGWEGGRIEDIIAEEIQASGRADRFESGGPSILLGASDVQPLSMILHELTTNALKYGALSVAEGRVSVTWQVGAPGWSMTWTERGGPAVSPPDQKGFGSRLINRLAAQLEGGAMFDWRPVGLQCHITSGGPPAPP